MLLLSKAAVLCAARGINRIAVGPLAGNPFPDATPQFFEAMARALTLGSTTRSASRLRSRSCTRKT